MLKVNPIIVAMDVPSAEEAVRLAQRLAPHVGGFKVGLGLLHGPGPAVVAALAQLGPVLADAKLHDIPTQVETAARRLGEYGARWVTVHASGGVEMMAAARSGLEARSDTAGILAVTVLTSLDAPELAKLGLGNRPGRLVARLAKRAAAAGVEGIVCSARELGDVAQVAPGLVRVIPGIRPDGSAGDDQRRVATPEEALGRGADHLVVGRPITAAADPEQAAADLAIRLGVHAG